MDLDLLNSFTVHLRNALARSIDLAWETQQEYIPPLFLLFSLSEQKESIGSQLLKSNNISFQIISKHVLIPKKVPVNAGADGQPHFFSFLWPEFSREAKKIIELAARTAFEFHHRYVGTEHLLYAILKMPDTEIDALFKKTKLPIEKIRQQLITILKTNAPLNQQNLAPLNSSQQPRSMITTTTHEEETIISKEVTPALNFFSRDLTAKEELQKIDPVIGREAEIERLIHVLMRRTKNNPVLIGEAGVGKTAIVEGLARRISTGQVPDILLHKKILALDLGLVIAGTMYRGEFESRLKQIIEELTQNPHIILFIDELHTIVGAGETGNNGNLDASNLLKPALAKGNIRCIGATTIEEYRRHIEHDAALERRFQPIVVKEPSLEETKEILKGLQPYYEKFHGVKIKEEAVEAAVELAERYLPEKNFPDKALDLLDEAGARCAVNRKLPEEIKKMHALRWELTMIDEKKEEAVRNEQFQKALEYTEQEKKLRQQFADLKRLIDQIRPIVTPLTRLEVAKVVQAITNVPLPHLLFSSTPTTMHFEEQMAARFFGQNEIIATVTAVIKRAVTNLSERQKPLGSFLLAGPSGVGKTEFARALAQTYFGREDALIKVDMGEFSESFHVAKLVGAPAGYVGYKEGSKFVDRVRRQPYSVILFDEIEKAHPDLFPLLAKIIDEGKLRDATDRELNFTNSIIILTSNVGTDFFNKPAEIGFGSPIKQTKENNFTEISTAVSNELKEVLPVEFINRLSHCLVLRPLTLRDMEKIVSLKLAEVQAKLKERQISLFCPAQTRRFLAKKSYGPDGGARQITKIIMEEVENPLADKILAGKIKNGDKIEIKNQKSKIKIQNINPKFKTLHF